MVNMARYEEKQNHFNFFSGMLFFGTAIFGLGAKLCMSFAISSYTSNIHNIIPFDPKGDKCTIVI